MIKLKLSVEQVQLILNAVGNLPFGQVETLVQEIRNQAVPQLNPQPEAPKDPPNDETA